MKKPAITRRAAVLPLVLGAWTEARSKRPELRLLAPPERGTPEADLLGFLSRLKSITDARDHRALEALMTPTFRVDFDAGKGPHAFRRRWVPESHESPVWPVLDRLLSLEGVRQGSSLYCCPYVYARFPLELDLLKHVVATGSEVCLLAEPKPGAAVHAKVSHAILPLAKPLAPPVDLTSSEFLELALPGESPCFVAASDVYSPAGYRLFLERQKGRWRWISLVCATLAYPPDLERLDRLQKKGRS